MVISPRAAHSLGLLVVRHDIVIVREFFEANWADLVLLDNLAV